MKVYHDKVEVATSVGVDRAHSLFVYAYHYLGAKTAPLIGLGTVRDSLPWFATGGARDSPIDHDRLNVLCLPRHL